jgi:hypothetical protein
MIPELDKYQGVVLKQLLAAHGKPIKVGVANIYGRVDAFSVEGAAIQIKHSSKRLSPWRFTYLPENLTELSDLSKTYDPVWAVLVCGQDGIVSLSLSEINSIVGGLGPASWIRVTRDRNSMYRVGGDIGDLPRAKVRGLEPFLSDVFRTALGVGGGNA